MGNNCLAICSLSSLPWQSCWCPIVSNAFCYCQFLFVIGLFLFMIYCLYRYCYYAPNCLNSRGIPHAFCASGNCRFFYLSWRQIGLRFWFVSLKLLHISQNVFLRKRNCTT